MQFNPDRIDVNYFSVIAFLCLNHLFVKWIYISILANNRSLALSSNLAPGLNRGQCDIFKDLTILQRKFCNENIELMPSVIKGSMLALRECQHQFRWRRWNCSTINKWKKRQNSPFGLALKSGKDFLNFGFRAVENDIIRCDLYSL